MKKWVIALLAAVLVLSAGVTAWSEEGTGRNIVLKIGDPYMTVNGVRQEVDPGRSTKPVVVSNRTLVPVRTIVENMGGTVNWVPQRQEVTVTVDDKIVTMIIGSDKAYIETIHAATPSTPAKWVKQFQKLDVPARAVNGRTMVPIRFVTESLGASVDWNESKKTVTIKFDISQGNTTPTTTPITGNTTTTTGDTTSTTGNTTSTTENTTTTTGNTTTTTGSTIPDSENTVGVVNSCTRCHPDH